MSRIAAAVKVARPARYSAVRTRCRAARPSLVSDEIACLPQFSGGGTSAETTNEGGIGQCTDSSLAGASLRVAVGSEASRALHRDIDALFDGVFGSRRRGAGRRLGATRRDVRQGRHPARPGRSARHRSQGSRHLGRGRRADDPRRAEGGQGRGLVPRGQLRDASSAASACRTVRSAEKIAAEVHERRARDRGPAAEAGGLRARSTVEVHRRRLGEVRLTLDERGRGRRALASRSEVYVRRRVCGGPCTTRPAHARRPQRFSAPPGQTFSAGRQRRCRDRRRPAALRPGARA